MFRMASKRPNECHSNVIPSKKKLNVSPSKKTKSKESHNSADEYREDKLLEGSLQPIQFCKEVINKFSAYRIFGGYQTRKVQFVEGQMEERGKKLEEIALGLLDIPMKSHNNGEVTITCCKNREHTQELDQETSKTLEENYPNQLDLSKITLYYNSDVILQDMKFEPDRVAFSITASEEETIEDLHLRMGGGGVSIWITSEEKIGKVRIVPSSDSISVTWKKKGNVVYFSCK